LEFIKKEIKNIKTKKRMNKRGITQAKAYFLMVNLVIAIVAFSVILQFLD